MIYCIVYNENEPPWPAGHQAAMGEVSLFFSHRTDSNHNDMYKYKPRKTIKQINILEFFIYWTLTNFQLNKCIAQRRGLYYNDRDVCAFWLFMKFYMETLSCWLIGGLKYLRGMILNISYVLTCRIFWPMFSLWSIYLFWQNSSFCEIYEYFFSEKYLLTG